MAAVTVVALLAVRVVVGVAAATGHGYAFDDLERFAEIARAPGRPYADYGVEYPPLTLALLKLLGWLAPTHAGFVAAVVSVSLLAEAVCGLLLWRTWGTVALLWFLLVDSLLAPLLAVRLDTVSVAVAVAGVAALRMRRPGTAGACIAAAAGLKLWPLALAPLLAAVAGPRERWRYLVAVSGCGAAIAVGWLALGGPAAVSQVLDSRGATGWQVESVVGAAVHLVTGEPVFNQAGADRFGHLPGAVPALLAAAAVIVALTAAWRAAWATLPAAWVLAVGAVIAASPVLSPQYIAWLVPAGALAWAAGDRRTAAAVAAVVAATLAENLDYAALTHVDRAAVALVLLRNAVLVAALAAAGWGMRRRPAGAGPARVACPVMDAERAKQLLAAERQRLLEVKGAADRLSDQALRATEGELSRVPIHPGDLGSEVEEREKDLAVRETVDAQLAELDAAEERLARGEYGRCAVCGRPIPDGRLEAMPATRYCVEDQARMERETAV